MLSKKDDPVKILLTLEYIWSACMILSRFLVPNLTLLEIVPTSTDKITFNLDIY